jgi:hypothetical protein
LSEIKSERVGGVEGRIKHSTKIFSKFDPNHSGQSIDTALALIGADHEGVEGRHLQTGCLSEYSRADCQVSGHFNMFTWQRSKNCTSADGFAEGRASGCRIGDWRWLRANEPGRIVTTVAFLASGKFNQTGLAL